MKSGFIAILGKPNVGKSSLMNALVGEKVSIVSPRNQTTRDSIMGIDTTDEYQMVFVDTPGVHVPKTKLGEYMSGAIKSAVDGVDAIVIVLDATKKIQESDISFIEKYLRGEASVYVVINKTDLAGYEKIYPMIAQLSHLTAGNENRGAIKEIIPTSAKTNNNIDTLKKYLVTELKDADKYFPDDDITDKSVRYMVCEIIREKALLFLQDEIPHGIGVYLQEMKTEEKLATISADIICEKDTHKAIIIGANGDKLKTIGESARRDIEKLVGTKVFLKLFVKVRADWRNKKSQLDDIGYKR